MRLDVLKEKIEAVICQNALCHEANFSNQSAEQTGHMEQAIAELADEIYNQYTQLGIKFLNQLFRNNETNRLSAAHIYPDPTHIPTHDTTPAIVISVSDQYPLTQTKDRLTYYVGPVTLTVRQGTAKVYSDQATVKSFGDSTVYAYGQTHVENNDQAKVYLYDNSRCQAKGGSVYATDHSFVQEEAPATIQLSAYSGGYFPYGISPIIARDSAQLLYSPSSRQMNRPAVKLYDKSILLLDNPQEHPLNIIRQSQYCLLINGQAQRIDPKDYLDYLNRRNNLPNTNCTPRTYNLESLKRKVSRYIQQPLFLKKLTSAKDESAVIDAMIPYLPQTLSHQGMTSHFLRSHFKKETLLAHNLYAFDDTPYIPNQPNKPGQPIFLFGTQIGHFTDQEQFYTYELSFAYATGQAMGTLNGQSRCLATDHATVTAKDLSHAYVSDQVQFQVEERAQGNAIGNAKGKVKDNGYMLINDHVQLQMEGQSRCEAKGWARVTLRQQSVALVDPFVTVLSKEESTVAIVTNEKMISDKIQQKDSSCAVLIPETGVEAFREKFLTPINPCTIQDFLKEARKPTRNARSLR